MIFEFGHQKVDIDVEKTRQFYASAGGMDCNCVNCTNFVKAVDILPESFKSVFSQLGIDMKKTPECYLNTMNQDGTLCYGGLYHVCGSIIDGAVSAEEINHHGFPYFSVSPDLKICFINEIALLEAGFPEPVVQLEFVANIPCVLESIKSYWWPIIHNKE